VEISIVILKRNRLRPRLKFGIIWIAQKMKQMQFVLASIFAENLNQIKSHGVKIYDYIKNE